MVAEHNSLYDAQNVSYALKINHYSDMTDDEIMWQPGEAREMAE